MSVSSQRDQAAFWPILAAICFGSFLATMGISAVNVAIPSLMSDFGADLSHVKWAVTGFILAGGVIAPVTGYLGDRLSPKYLYIVSLIGFTIASALCAMAWNVGSLVAFRILQGAFSGMIMPATMTIIYQVIPRERQPFANSMWSLSSVLAPALGPTLAGWLIQTWSWHWLFWLNLPFGVVGVLVAMKLLPYYRLYSPKPFDLPGFVMVTSCSTAFLIAFSEVDQWGWTSWKTLGLLALGAVVLAAFIRRARRVEAPLLQLQVFANRRFTLTLILGSIILISLYSGSYLTPVFLQTIQQAGAMEAGLTLLPGSAAMAVFMPIAGRLYSKVGPAALITAGILLIGAGMIAMGQLTPDISRTYIMGWMTVRNIGIALATMPAANAGMEEIEAELTGHASSASNWVKQGFGSLSIGLITSLLSLSVAMHTKELAGGGTVTGAVERQAFTDAVNDVTLLAAATAFLCLPLVWTLRRRKAQSGSVGNPAGRKAFSAE
ncbi:putative multidrug resistance protein EmrY [Paenibacillus konkukensis]|uniref:Multidrug resistance protein EmrY n=1 Tax=Paenibacillus konkukensis TaxID=2020716 RepID=A0ABY4RRJ1_9BACL|nr:MDR family MFS transporter [Paenibacillus konkukensis]UQZ85149.1 putative multidrug resistance protein EmrY [Paenibacillus konkukensis]